MKKYILLALTLTLVGCGSNSDGSSKSTYSSCKITQSNAILALNRDNDLKQCWNASGNGYESQADALQWCEKTVNNYLSNKYLVAHSVTYAVESTYCPK